MSDSSVNSAVGLAFQELVEIIRRLRDPIKGCPWDREQTHASLKHYLVEETYEALEAIDTNLAQLKGELGDVLLQVLLHSQIACEEKLFDIEGVVRTLSAKMIERHPHVFAADKVSGAAEVATKWEQSKHKTAKSAMDGVPKSLPALHRAQRLGQKAASVGFEWRQTRDTRDKVLEEIAEFLRAAPTSPEEAKHYAEEFGDILFALVQLARRLGLQAEELLQQANDKFLRRFQAMEQLAGPDPKKMEVEKWDLIWEEVKAKERNT